MSARVSELHEERDSAVAEIKTLRQRVECTSDRLSSMADIISALKSAGYSVEEGETLFVRWEGLVISIGVTATSSVNGFLTNNRYPGSKITR